MTITAKDGGCPIHTPPHEHGEGQNECSICDEPVPCGNCGHTHFHGYAGCAGCKTGPCTRYVRPPCTCKNRRAQ